MEYVWPPRDMWSMVFPTVTGPFVASLQSIFGSTLVFLETLTSAVIYGRVPISTSGKRVSRSEKTCVSLYSTTNPCYS